LNITDSPSPIDQDTDRSGTIGFNEVRFWSFLTTAHATLNLSRITQFAGLWKYIKDWQNVFRHFDRDRSGSIDGQELAEALRQFGYNLSPPLLQLVERKYGACLGVTLTLP
jgi:peflin